MGIRNSALIAIWSVVIFSTNVIAKDIAIYRWVDENNVVHFSQHQPQTNSYSQLTTFASYKAKQLSKNKKMSSVDNKITQHEKEQALIAAKNKVIAKKNCTAAQLNIKMLHSLTNVSTVDADGKNHVLTDKEKIAQIKLSNKHIGLYCNKRRNKDG